MNFNKHKARRRKKIRGWKRRVKNLVIWGQSISQPYLSGFDLRGSTYEKAIIKDFYIGNGKRHPPLWFFKLIIDKFAAAFEQWDKNFTEHDKPFDLQLWIYNPHFIQSQLVCRIKIVYFFSIISHISYYD